jgi:citrate lyase beta subunit
MPTSLTPNEIEGTFETLRVANQQFALDYPGDSEKRQPVHTVYGGAQIFKSDTAQKLGAAALKSLNEYAPNAGIFARALGLNVSTKLQKKIYERVVAKLRTEPVEDFRIDFEDGYGNRTDAEEDGHAEFCAREVAKGMANHSLPPYVGMRVKPFTQELKARAIRTLDIFITTLLQQSGGTLPGNFVVTIPKVVDPRQISALVELLRVLERATGLDDGSLKLEFMVETPQAIFNHRGEVPLPLFVEAAQGRCVAAHFGVYDYTASNNITSKYQSMVHPAADFARTVMKVSLAGTGVWISDGATNVMPVGPHRANEGKKLTAKERSENRTLVHRVWRLNFAHINHSLMQAFYQGWDLHPAQFPVRYAATYNFFLAELEATSVRLKTFVEKAAQASLIGEVFDDAATGQGLLNFFLRGIGCGAITEQEALATGLTVDEIRSRSFVKILSTRSGRY